LGFGLRPNTGKVVGNFPFEKKRSFNIPKERDDPKEKTAVESQKKTKGLENPGRGASFIYEGPTLWAPYNQVDAY